MNDRVHILAQNVQRLRESHGLSLAQLAERSGVAKATLFKVERGTTNPTLDTMSAIARTLLTDVTDLLAPPPRAAVELVRAGQGLDISDDASDGRVLKSMLVGSLRLEVHSLCFRAGYSETSVSHGAGSREHVLVRRGRIKLGPVSEQVEASAGDYATYASDVPLRWTVVGDEDAEVWVIITFPLPTAA